MRSCRELIIPLILGSLVVTLMGCTTQTRGDRPTRLAPRENAYLGDVPVPRGFEIVGQASEDAKAGQQRLYARHVYSGRADAYAVRSFYLEGMPHYQWQKVSELSVKGIHTLRFEKGSESCTVRIYRPSIMWSPRLEIEIVILQEERGVKLPERQRSR